VGDTTAVYDFPYPVGTDRVRDGDNAIQALAESVEAVLLPGLVPTGVVVPFVGAGAPTGWLLAQGQAVSRTAYATLFGVISTTYGAGDGSTTFNLPDLRSRLPLGEGTGTALRNRVRGLNGGGEDQVAAHGHYAAGVDTNHSHGIGGDGDHAHGLETNHSPGTADYASGTGRDPERYIPSGARRGTFNAGSHAHGGGTGWQSADHGHSVLSAGVADGNMPPYCTLSYIIKT